MTVSLNNILLNFNHHVKELFWIIRREDTSTAGGNILTNDYFDFSSHLNSTEDADNCITLNNQDCTAPRSSKYFSLMQLIKG